MFEKTLVRIPFSQVESYFHFLHQRKLSFDVIGTRKKTFYMNLSNEDRMALQHTSVLLKVFVSSEKWNDYVRDIKKTA